MRVGLPSEASSCRWSARGPRDRPDRRRNGLAHVVRAYFSFLLIFFLRNGILHIFAEGGVCTRLLTLLRFPSVFLLFLSPIGKERAARAKNFPKLFLGV